MEKLPSSPPPLSSTDRTRLRRHPERAETDRAALNAILDAGWVVHIAFDAGAGQPLVIPTAYVRIDEHIYFHGAVANAMLRAAGGGANLCATVTLLDGLVLARSAFHHSMNYRSAVILGRARVITDAFEKQRVLEALLERLVPGRMQTARPPNVEELKTTSVLALPLDEASVKVRTGPPIDGESDLAWPAWAGVIPLGIASSAPEPAAGAPGMPPARTLAGPVAASAAAVVKSGTLEGFPDPPATDYARHAELRPHVQPGTLEGFPDPPATDYARHAELRPHVQPGTLEGFPDPPATDYARHAELRPSEQRHRDWVLSDDRSRVDFARVTAWLAGSYWCPGIPRAAVERAAQYSSLVAGAYDAAGEQVGYLRVVSDCTRFANLMDVFVAEAHRRRGLGRALVRYALAHPAHREIARWMLGTKDAHAVYALEGFRPVEEPSRLMQRVVAPPWSAP